MKIKYIATIQIEVTEEISGNHDLIVNPKETFDENIKAMLEDEFSGEVKVDIKSDFIKNI